MRGTSDLMSNSSKAVCKCSTGAHAGDRPMELRAAALMAPVTATSHEEMKIYNK